ncbi:MAG: hypothetical protein IPK68_05565 [Bdellovibrionales bacterium]|nr:hypothetical protein [Bdellovibrionales bacterium]
MKKKKPLCLAVSSPEQNPFMKNRVLAAWAQTYEMHGRVFSVNGFHAITSRTEEVPYNDEMKDFIHAVSISMRNLPRFYFDIVKHSSGVDMIKFDEKRTYDCTKLLEGFLPAERIPNNGFLSSENAALLISMYASYVWYDYLKSEGKESTAQAHVERYKALAKSQPNSPIIEDVLILFPEFQQEIIEAIDLELNNKPAS